MAEGDARSDRERAVAERRAAATRRREDRRARIAERSRRLGVDRAARRAEAALGAELVEVYRRRQGPETDAGAAPGEGSIHWMVPARRAVLRDALDYGQLISLWVDELRRHLPALATWYYDCSVESEIPTAIQQLLDGIDAVGAWRDGTVRHVAVEGSHVLDHRGFKVRLWKGPLRVLREQQAVAGGDAGSDEEPSDGAEDEHAGEAGSAAPASPPTSTVSVAAAPPSADAAATSGAEPDDPIAEEGEDAPDAGAVADNLYGESEEINAREVDSGGAVVPGARHRQPSFRLALSRGAPQQDITLVLNDFGEVDPDGTTMFLPGDVVEFPIWKLLRHPEHHRSYSNIEFNPRGSFLLGTSVRVRGQSVSPPPDAPLHDNLIGMRFQALMSAARGAFYRMGRVFNSFPQEVPKLQLGSTLVTARGLMYAGTLQAHDIGAASGIWGIQNSHWGVLQGGTQRAKNLPNTTATFNLAANRLTPGWTCTPSQGYTMMYMRDALAGPHMNGSPGQEITNPASPWLRDVDVTVGQWFPALGRTVNQWAKDIWDRHHAAGLVAPTAPPPEPHVPEPPPALPAPPDPAAAAADVIRAYTEAIRVLLDRRRRLPERRRALEERMRYDVVCGRLRDQETRARMLAEAAAAEEAERATPARPPPRGSPEPEPTWDEQLAQARRRNVPAEPAPSHDDVDRVATDLRDLTVRFVLSSAADPATRQKGLHDLELAYTDAATPPIGERSANINASLAADFAPDNVFWQQYNVIVMGSHTFGVVRMRRSDALCDHPSPSARKPPQVGFLTSYEPLSGVPHVGVPHAAGAAAPDEEMYTFEAGGALARSPGHAFFGSQPHHVKLVRQFRVRLHGSRIQWSTMHIDNLPMDAGSDGRPARLQAILRLRDDRLEAIHRARVDEHRGFEPIGFGDKHGGFLGAKQPTDLHAERAVPFLAFDEAAGASYGDEVMPNIQASRDWLDEVRGEILRSLGFRAEPPGSEPPSYVAAPGGLSEPARQRWNAMFNQADARDPHA